MIEDEEGKAASPSITYPTHTPATADEFHRLLMLATAAGCGSKERQGNKRRAEKSLPVSEFPEAPPPRRRDANSPTNAEKEEMVTHDTHPQGALLRSLFTDEQRHSRCPLSDKAVGILKDWFLRHVHQPYPNTAEKEDLCRSTGLSRTQVCNWFTNTRKRQWSQVRSVCKEQVVALPEWTRIQNTSSWSNLDDNQPQVTDCGVADGTTTNKGETEDRRNTTPSEAEEGGGDDGERQREGRRTKIRKLTSTAVPADGSSSPDDSDETPSGSRSPTSTTTRKHSTSTAATNHINIGRTGPRRFNKHSWEQLTSSGGEEENNDKLKLLLSPVPGSNTPYAKPTVLFGRSGDTDPELGSSSADNLMAQNNHNHNHTQHSQGHHHQHPHVMVASCVPHAHVAAAMGAQSTSTHPDQIQVFHPHAVQLPKQAQQARHHPLQQQHTLFQQSLQHLHHQQLLVQTHMPPAVTPATPVTQLPEAPVKRA